MKRIDKKERRINKMRKVKEIILIIVGAVILVGMLFFAVDYNRVKQGKTPIFCLRNPAGVIKDGGTVEYFGLGYKVIDFNMLNGYDEIKIGTWVMNYNDFKDEFKKLDNIDTKNVKLEELPQNYSIEKAVKDGCFVITYNKIYNKHILENFINNTGINAKERKEDSIRIVQYTTEGDPIITEVSFEFKDETYTFGNEEVKKSHYIVKHDSTRDKFASEEDRKITTNEDFPGSFYGITEMQKDQMIEVSLALYAEIGYVTPDAHIYENYNICSYNINAIVENNAYSFFATVVESSSNSIIVEPYTNEEIRKSADKISVGLGKNNDMIYQVGTNVKITYDGTVMESYPAQIVATSIEIKSADNFELSFYDKQPESNIKVHTIVDKNETDKYDYNIYAFDGDVSITIDGKFMSLREALLNNKITMDEIIIKANKDFPQSISYDDGGSMEYHYPGYTIIKLHKINGNRDVYIGGHDLKLNDLRL